MLYEPAETQQEPGDPASATQNDPEVLSKLRV